MHPCTPMHAHMHTRTDVCTCTHAHTHVCTNVHTCTHARTRTRAQVCTCSTEQSCQRYCASRGSTDVFYLTLSVFCMMNSNIFRNFRSSEMLNYRKALNYASWFHYPKLITSILSCFLVEVLFLKKQNHSRRMETYTKRRRGRKTLKEPLSQQEAGRRAFDTKPKAQTVWGPRVAPITSEWKMSVQ